MYNLLKNNIIYSLVILSTGAALSACGSKSSSTPTTMPAYSTVYYVHNLVFNNRTTLLSTGYNAFGQLGNGTLANSSVPGPVIPPAQNYHYKGFAAGGDHSVAFMNNSSVFCWGYNAFGQLGNNSIVSSPFPVKTVGISRVKAVAAGAFHTLALNNDNTVSAWGSNTYGQLGYPTPLGLSLIPGKIVDPAAITISNVSAIAANGYNSMALANGQVWTWGYNFSGQLGRTLPSPFTSSEVPLTVADLPPGITGIAAGSASSYAVDGDTKVWAWGNNSNGQLGNGTVIADSNIPVTNGCATATIPSYVPVQVMTSLTNPLTNVVQVAAGYHHGLARLGDGSVWAWGANLYGQLGNISVIGNGCFAVQVTLPLKAVDIRAFGSSSMAQTEDGAWYAWGNNLFGQLGVGTSGLNSTVPLPVKMFGF